VRPRRRACCWPRGVQGLGGAIVSPAALAIVLAIFSEGPERNRALAVWGAISGQAARLACSAACSCKPELALGVLRQRSNRDGRPGACTPGRPESRSETGRRGGYDVPGAVAITLGTMVLVFTLIRGDGWGWGSAQTVAGLAVAALLIVAFVGIERPQRDPLVPLRIFCNRGFAAANATMLAVAAALFGMFFFCAPYLQQVLGKGPLATGIAFLPLSLAVIAPPARRRAWWPGSPRSGCWSPGC
jgi:MFS family permease